MAYELKIHYEGDVPGIAEHRLSVSAFGEPLSQLLSTLRRIATQMVRMAVEGERPKVGRFADLGRSLDIEITHINGNSLGIESVISFRPPIQPQAMLPYWDNLPERAGVELLDAIERECRGELANAGIRSYLAMLPPGITRQEYNFHANGRPIKEVRVGAIKLTSMPSELPYLQELTGNIVGVGFDPGRSEVRVKPEGGNVANISATNEEVDRAIDVRHEKVRTLAIHTSKGMRLISLKRASEPRAAFDPETARRQIDERWREVLRELAK
jgi:hypothetical protein